MEKLRVAVIIGSTREGRVGEEIARWFVRQAGQRPDLDISVIDLNDFTFPDRYPEQPTSEMRDFTKRVDTADAFAIVTPEYNRSFPASLKQAIDYAYDEWHGKPVGFVSYGYRCEGRYAVDHLRAVFSELHVATMRDVVGVNLLDENPLDEHEPQAKALLDQLTWWGRALREARPYVS
jgi:NAD(P)H-dependent FMN reductase